MSLGVASSERGRALDNVKDLASDVNEGNAIPDEVADLLGTAGGSEDGID